MAAFADQTGFYSALLKHYITMLCDVIDLNAMASIKCGRCHEDTALRGRVLGCGNSRAAAWGHFIQLNEKRNRLTAATEAGSKSFPPFVDLLSVGVVAHDDDQTSRSRSPRMRSRSTRILRSSSSVIESFPTLGCGGCLDAQARAI
jgi:hypothetical protein